MFDIPAAPGLQPSTASSPLPGPTPSPILMPTPGPHTTRKPSAARTPAKSPLQEHRKSPLAKCPPRARDRRPPDRRPAGAGTPRDDVVPGYGEVLLGLAPPVPDWALMDGLERVMELLGRLGDGEPTAAAVTARGWIEWCRGRGSDADALYRQALRERPDYRLAELLAELGGRGTLCGWAARRETAWQKFAPDAA